MSRRLAKDTAGRVYEYQSLEQAEARRRFRFYNKDKRTFSFSHMQNIREITRNLSNKYCGYILLLQPYIAFKSGVLIKPGRTMQPLTLREIADIWEVSDRTAKTVISELERRSIIFTDGSGDYSLNERYHFRKKGSSEVDALIKTYSTALHSFKLTAADMGFVYKLLPHVHYETNLICADPFVASENVVFLTDKEIGGIVGLSETKTKEALGRLRKARIIAEWADVDDKRRKFTVLNPYVFYRRNDKPDGLLRAIFRD